MLQFLLKFYQILCKEKRDETQKSIGEFHLTDLNFNKSIGKTILSKMRKAVVEPLDRT